MKPTLVILAAGMASRYGSMKQTEGFGPNEETIIDYSIYSAIEAGFGKVVFIIRREFKETFSALFAEKLAGKIEVAYVFQESDMFVNAADIPAGRTKPWGTGHAVLCCKDEVKEPFAVINADDFYGQDAFRDAFNFLTSQCDEKHYALMGYKLSNTLSENGTVSRGVSEADENGNLKEINERTKIRRSGADIIFEDGDQSIVLDPDTPVSMNFWCFHPSVFALAEELFRSFPRNNTDNIKAEFFIPAIATEFMKRGGTIAIIRTASPWFGVTYKEDAPGVKEGIAKLIESGEYPRDLWS